MINDLITNTMSILAISPRNDKFMFLDTIGLNETKELQGYKVHEKIRQQRTGKSHE